MLLAKRRAFIRNAAKRKPPSPLKADPSRTYALRKRFERAFRVRFNRLKKAVIELVASEDAFGLKPEPENPFAFNTRWKFRTNAEQLKAFEDWLKTQIETEVLPADGPEAYWNAFIQEAYARGTGRAFDDLNKSAKAAGQNLDFYNGTRAQFLNSSFNNPASVEQVKLLAGRVYTDLRGVTEAMAGQMKRQLVDGMIQGANPRDIARQMSATIDGVGIRRAETIARTETMRAHAEAQIDAFEKLGVKDLGVAVEWSTAGDGRVCPRCQPMEGAVFSLQESRGMLPRHPNCRCVFLPSGVGETKDAQARTKPALDAAVKKSIAAETPSARTVKEARDKSRWLGAGKRIGKDRPVSILDKVPSIPKTASEAMTGQRVKVNGVSRAVYRVDGVNYVKDSIPGSKDVVVIVADVMKLDKLWKKHSPDLYIPKGGGGAEIGGRRDEFERFLAEDPNRPIEMPRVGVIPANSRFNDSDEPIVGFANGRHRFSIMRDKNGKKAIAIQVDRSTVKEAMRLLGIE
jgi:SPP1 gp7 family putative phage head morphogenesis protein